MGNYSFEKQFRVRQIMLTSSWCPVLGDHERSFMTELLPQH